MSTNNNSPRVSPTERYLAKRGLLYEEELPPLLVRVVDTVVQMPQELALNLIRLRKATAIADPNAVASLILNEADIDEELELALLKGTL